MFSNKMTCLFPLLMLMVPTTIAKAPKTNTNPPAKLSKPDIKPQHDAHSLRRLVTNTTIATEVFSKQQRALSGNDTCSICRGAQLLEDFMPLYPPSEELPPNLTCGHWEQIAQTEVPPALCESSGIRQFYTQCCESKVPVYSCEKNIRNKILEGYDPAIPPLVSHQTPMNVTFRLEYFTVVSIDVQDGSNLIYFSMLMNWMDPRLAWEVNEEHCADHVTAYASMDREKTEIWVPDLDLYNQLEGVQGMPDTMAIVYPNGQVVWNRIGGLTAFCQFTGVSKIPFDELGCQLIFGPWVRMNPNQVRYHLWNGTGLIFGDYEPSYNEYYPIPEMAESGYSYGGSILYFNFYFRRSKNYYVFNLIVPTIILTYVSMGTFLLDLRVGERLSYGMALALVVVAQQIATGGMIPVSNERLWIDKFIGWSFYWVIVGLLESVFVGYLYFLREDMQSNIDSDETEENRTRVIYDGMRTSVFDKDKRPSNLALNGTVNNNRPEGEPRQIEVDVDEWYPDKKKSSITNHTLDGEQEEAPPAERRATALTFKLQMQNANPNPRRQMKRTNTLRSVEDEKEADPCQVARYWQWMYTISLRQMDRFFFFLTLTTYTLFLIAMFISIEYWGRSVDDVWMDESSGGGKTVGEEIY